MPELISVLTDVEIKKRVASIARKISSDYQNQELVLIGVLKGAFIFLSDLAREISLPVKIDFVETTSYGKGTRSSGKVLIKKKIEIDVAGKNVLLVEDIVDTGLTIKALKDYIISLNPKTLKICALLDKHERRRENIRIDYVCHEIQTGYLVGYGLDHADDYRHLPHIYELKI